MFFFIHQPVTVFVGLPFGAGQVACGIRAWFLKTATARNMIEGQQVLQIKQQNCQLLILSDKSDEQSLSLIMTHPSKKNIAQVRYVWEADIPAP